MTTSPIQCARSLLWCLRYQQPKLVTWQNHIRWILDLNISWKRSGRVPRLEKAARSDSGAVHDREAVLEAANGKKGGNTHFGAFIVSYRVWCAGRCENSAAWNAGSKSVRGTTVDDAVESTIIFRSRVKVKNVKTLTWISCINWKNWMQGLTLLTWWRYQQVMTW